MNKKLSDQIAKNISERIWYNYTNKLYPIDIPYDTAKELAYYMTGNRIAEEYANDNNTQELILEYALAQPDTCQPERLSEKTKESKNKGWFSVKDKLPGIKQNLVLVYSKDHGYEIARFVAESNGHFFCIGQDVRQTREPEFWMPIVSLDAIV